MIFCIFSSKLSAYASHQPSAAPVDAKKEAQDGVVYTVGVPNTKPKVVQRKTLPQRTMKEEQRVTLGYKKWEKK